VAPVLAEKKPLHIVNPEVRGRSRAGLQYRAPPANRCPFDLVGNRNDALPVTTLVVVAEMGNYTLGVTVSARFPDVRPRRLRRTAALRTMFQETEFSLDDLILPIFVEEDIDDFQEIRSMPGVMRIPEARLASEVERYARAGVRAVMTFGVSHNKDAVGSNTWSEDGLVARIARTCKTAVPEMVVISDTCFCEYTGHGHCGVLCDGDVDNAATLVNLGKQAVIAGRAGADFIAPSAAMDGQVAAIRAALDGAGLSGTAIMSYSTKIASSLYGPFREAGGATLRGDRKAYQMNPMNRREAVRESLQDELEGADVVMVKPAGMYLDMLSDIRSASRLPLAAYQVSGEYAMIRFASAAGAINEYPVVRESIGALKRAGADLILTYFAMDIAVQGV
jgi:porphobilinogen synthase